MQKYILLILAKTGDEFRFRFNLNMIERHCQAEQLKGSTHRFTRFLVIKILCPKGVSSGAFRTRTAFFESVVDGLYSDQRLQLFYNTEAVRMYRNSIIRFIERHEHLVSLKELL